LKKLKKHHKRQSWLRRVWWKVRSWIKRVYGVRDGEESEEGRKWRLSKPKRERNGHCRGSGSGRKHLPPKFVKAIKDVQRVNKKLSSFERGFISEEGIKGREWYKHLGVAPGKWLGLSFRIFSSTIRALMLISVGYGATTLPGMTEALQLDKNVTLAEYESERLTDLINKLSHSLLQK
jgi:N-acetylated-alpha-linked acidic dipeptidase